MLEWGARGDEDDGIISEDVVVCRMRLLCGRGAAVFDELCDLHALGDYGDGHAVAYVAD